MIDALLTNLDVLLLLLFGFAALAGGASMLVLREPMRVAIALIFTMVCLAAIYGLVGVHFIAAFQVLIYVGAVMVFMVFAIMLLEDRGRSAARYSKMLWPGGVAFVLVLGVIVASIWRPLPSPTAETGQAAFGVADFSVAFLGEYWLHFELASVLLVAAVVAAIAVIRIGRSTEKGPRRG